MLFRTSQEWNPKIPTTIYLLPKCPLYEWMVNVYIRYLLTYLSFAIRNRITIVNWQFAHANLTLILEYPYLNKINSVDILVLWITLLSTALIMGIPVQYCWHRKRALLKFMMKHQYSIFQKLVWYGGNPIVFTEYWQYSYNPNSYKFSLKRYFLWGL